ncbi:MAG: hypothetical protein A2138_16025 [Deltaproteobacteria bacterium RBG_16_71_12]|nr:MAG: hypothetical protein A2138_16025 [Deltaproteobacteria bacterium RBG_16_71_12]
MRDAERSDRERRQQAGDQVSLEARLRRSEAWLAGIVDMTTDAVVSLDEANRITLFNAGAERMFGYTREEILGEPLDVLIPERFRSGHRASVAMFSSGPRTARRMGELGRHIYARHKDGTEFPVDVAISTLELEGVRTVTASLRDMTTQVRAMEEQRFLSEAGAILSSSLDYEATLSTVAQLAVRNFTDVCMVQVLDEHDRLHRLRTVARDPALDGACRALSAASGDWARSLAVADAAETRKAVCLDTGVDEVAARLSQSEEDARALRALGARSALVVPLVARDQQLGVICFLSTSDARRHSCHDLPLAEAIALRAAHAIDNARLYRTAQRAVHARDEVLGVVAHDLRNPLSAVLMQTQLLRPRLVNPDQRTLAAVDSVRRAVVRMNRMIEDLLDVTRMEAGRLAVDRCKLAAAPVVAEAIEGQRPLADAAGIELVADVADHVADVYADHGRLLQILENLIGNALKFTGSGGRVTVGLAARGDDVVFSVADNGAGIAAEDLPHVFDRFWQGSTHEHRGAGLGLQIVKGLVEAHGGSIWVDSAVGAGTTFSFSIPLEPPNAA